MQLFGDPYAAPLLPYPPPAPPPLTPPPEASSSSHLLRSASFALVITVVIGVIGVGLYFLLTLLVFTSTSSSSHHSSSSSSSSSYPSSSYPSSSSSSSTGPAQLPASSLFSVTNQVVAGQNYALISVADTESCITGVVNGNASAPLSLQPCVNGDLMQVWILTPLGGLYLTQSGYFLVAQVWDGCSEGASLYQTSQGGFPLINEAFFYDPYAFTLSTCSGLYYLCNDMTVSVGCNTEQWVWGTWIDAWPMATLPEDTTPITISIDWTAGLMVLNTTVSMQAVANPLMAPQSPIYDQIYATLAAFNTSYLNLQGWYPYPYMSCPQINPGLWNFTYMDPVILDFFATIPPHSNGVLNIDPIPNWMFDADYVTVIPSQDPFYEDFSWLLGGDPVDASCQQIGQYWGRIASWYMNGGFTDENDVYHSSGYHLPIKVWEVGTELEQMPTIQVYVCIYDQTVNWVRQMADPGHSLEFMGLALAQTQEPTLEFVSYFLNSSNHNPTTTPLDWISYHFYGVPADTWDVTTYTDLFVGFDTLLSTAQQIDAIRQQLSPSTRTNVEALGCGLPNEPFGNSLFPTLWWNACSAGFVYTYIQLSLLEIEVVGFSQWIGNPNLTAPSEGVLPPQFQSISMLDWRTGYGTPKFYVSQMIAQYLQVGVDVLVCTTVSDPSIYAQAYVGGGRSVLLVVNLLDSVNAIAILGSWVTAISVLDSNGPPRTTDTLSDDSILILRPFAVAVLSGPYTGAAPTIGNNNCSVCIGDDIQPGQLYSFEEPVLPVAPFLTSCYQPWTFSPNSSIGNTIFTPFGQQYAYIEGNSYFYGYLESSGNYSVSFWWIGGGGTSLCVLNLGFSTIWAANTVPSNWTYVVSSIGTVPVNQQPGDDHLLFWCPGSVYGQFIYMDEVNVTLLLLTSSTG